MVPQSPSGCPWPGFIISNIMSSSQSHGKGVFWSGFPLLPLPLDNLGGRRSMTTLMSPKTHPGLKSGPVTGEIPPIRSTLQSIWMDLELLLHNRVPSSAHAPTLVGTANPTCMPLGFQEHREEGPQPPGVPAAVRSSPNPPRRQGCSVAKQLWDEPRSCLYPAPWNLATAPSAQNFSLGYQAVFHPRVISPAWFMFIVD